jgi:hypothetical protein
MKFTLPTLALLALALAWMWPADFSARYPPGVLVDSDPDQSPASSKT